MEDGLFVIDVQPSIVAAHKRYEGLAPHVLTNDSAHLTENAKPNVVTAPNTADTREEQSVFSIDTQPSKVINGLRRKADELDQPSPRKYLRVVAPAHESSEEEAASPVDVESLDEDDLSGMDGIEVAGELDIIESSAVQDETLANPTAEEIQLLQKMQDAYDEEEEGGGGRYWVKNRREDRSCAKCRQVGHLQRDCPNTMCFNCGAMNDHELRDCMMSKTCNRCGLKGHLVSKCFYRTGDGEIEPCAECPGFPHTRISCAKIWRRYVFRQQPQALRATRGLPPALFCYNCAAHDHLGDDCPFPRGHPLRPTDPTPFTLRQPGEPNVGDVTRARRPNIVNGVSDRRIAPTHQYRSDKTSGFVPPIRGAFSEAHSPIVLDESSDEDLLAGSRARQKQGTPRARQAAPVVHFDKRQHSRHQHSESPPPRYNREPLAFEDLDDRYGEGPARSRRLHLPHREQLIRDSRPQYIRKGGRDESGHRAPSKASHRSGPSYQGGYY